MRLNANWEPSLPLKPPRLKPVVFVVCSLENRTRKTCENSQFDDRCDAAAEYGRLPGRMAPFRAGEIDPSRLQVRGVNATAGRVAVPRI